MLTEAEFNMNLMFAMFIGAKQLFPMLVSINLNSPAPLMFLLFLYAKATSYECLVNSDA